MKYCRLLSPHDLLEKDMKMPQSIQPPRIVVRPSADVNALTTIPISFPACCDDPTPGFIVYPAINEKNPNPVLTGFYIYCESCDTTLLKMLWNKFDMEEYSGYRAMIEADEASQNELENGQ